MIGWRTWLGWTFLVCVLMRGQVSPLRPMVIAPYSEYRMRLFLASDSVIARIPPAELWLFPASARTWKWISGDTPHTFRFFVWQDTFLSVRIFPLVGGYASAGKGVPPMEYGLFKGIYVEGHAGRRFAFASWFLDVQWNPSPHFQFWLDTVAGGPFFPNGPAKDFSGFWGDTLWTRGQDVNPAGGSWRFRIHRTLELRVMHEFQHVGWTRPSLVEDISVPPRTSVELLFSHGQFWYRARWVLLQGTPPGAIVRYLTEHSAGWQAPSRKFQVFLTEMVMQGARPSPYYLLNPLILFRSLEHLLGNPHNIAWAGGFWWRIHRRWHLFGTIMVDDLYIPDLRTDMVALWRRWTRQPLPSQWGSYRNRWALSGGLAFSLFPEHDSETDLLLLIESGVVRPYTFSHINSETSLTHLGIPLGGTGSANAGWFRSEVYFRRERWQVHAGGFYRVSGLDEPQKFWGTSPRKPYTQAQVQYLYNTVGQGIPWRHEAVWVRLSWRIRSGMEVWLQARGIRERKGTNQKETALLLGGISWNVVPWVIEHFLPGN